MISLLDSMKLYSFGSAIKKGEKHRSIYKLVTERKHNYELLFIGNYDFSNDALHGIYKAGGDTKLRFKDKACIIPYYGTLNK
jgi:hypothetical protein